MLLIVALAFLLPGQSSGPRRAVEDAIPDGVGAVEHRRLDLRLHILDAKPGKCTLILPLPPITRAPPSTNASTLVRPSWRRDSLAVTLERVLAPARKMGRGAHEGGVRDRALVEGDVALLVGQPLERINNRVPGPAGAAVAAQGQL